MKLSQQAGLAALLIIMFGMLGCASGPQFRGVSAAPPDAALIYLYRLKHYNAWAGLVPNATPYRITIDGDHIVNLSNGGYYSFIARPETNTIGSAMVYPPKWTFLAMMINKKELLKPEFEPGKTYFLKFEVGAFGSRLTVMDPAIGEKEIRQCKLVGE